MTCVARVQLCLQLSSMLGVPAHAPRPMHASGPQPSGTIAIKVEWDCIPRILGLQGQAASG